MPDVQTPEPSPGTTDTQVQTPAHELPYREKLSQLNPGERDEWNRSGKFPERFNKPSPAAAPPEKEEAGKTTPDSEPGKDIGDSSEERSRAQREYAHRRDRRERNQAIREAADAKAQLAVAQRELDELKKGRTASAAADDKEPDQSTYDDFNKYIADLVQHRVKATLKDQTAQTEQRQKTETDQAAKEHDAEVQREWTKRAAAARKADKDFDTKVQNVAARIAEAQASVLDALLPELEEGPAFIGYLDSHPEEFDALLDAFDSSEREGHFALGALLHQMKSPKPKTQTQAPEPGRTVGSRANAASDPLDEAAKRKDWKAYNDEADRRAREHRKTGRF